MSYATFSESQSAGIAALTICGLGGCAMLTSALLHLMGCCGHAEVATEANQAKLSTVVSKSAGAASKGVNVASVGVVVNSAGPAAAGTTPCKTPLSALAPLLVLIPMIIQGLSRMGTITVGLQMPGVFTTFMYWLGVVTLDLTLPPWLKVDAVTTSAVYAAGMTLLAVLMGMVIWSDTSRFDVALRRLHVLRRDRRLLVREYMYRLAREQPDSYPAAVVVAAEALVMTAPEAIAFASAEVPPLLLAAARTDVEERAAVLVKRAVNETVVDGAPAAPECLELAVRRFLLLRSAWLPSLGRSLQLSRDGRLLALGLQLQAKRLAQFANATPASVDSDAAPRCHSVAQDARERKRQFYVEAFAPIAAATCVDIVGEHAELLDRCVQEAALGGVCYDASIEVESYRLHELAATDLPYPSDDSLPAALLLTLTSWEPQAAAAAASQQPAAAPIEVRYPNTDPALGALLQSLDQLAATGAGFAVNGLRLATGASSDAVTPLPPYEHWMPRVVTTQTPLESQATLVIETCGVSDAREVTHRMAVGIYAAADTHRCPRHGGYLIKADEGRHFAIPGRYGQPMYRCMFAAHAVYRFDAACGYRQPCGEALYVCADSTCSAACCDACMREKPSAARHFAAGLVDAVRRMPSPLGTLLLLVYQSCWPTAVRNLAGVAVCRPQFLQSTSCSGPEYVTAIVLASLSVAAVAGVSAVTYIELARRRRALLFVGGDRRSAYAADTPLSSTDFRCFLDGDVSVLGRLYASLELWAIVWNEVLSNAGVVALTLAALLPAPGDPYGVLYVGCAALAASGVPLLSVYDDKYMDVAAKLRSAFELLLLAVRASAQLSTDTTAAAQDAIGGAMIGVVCVQLVLVGAVVYLCAVAPYRRAKWLANESRIRRLRQQAVEDTIAKPNRRRAQLLALKADATRHFGGAPSLLAALLLADVAALPGALEQDNEAVMQELRECCSAGSPDQAPRVWFGTRLIDWRHDRHVLRAAVRACGERAIGDLNDALFRKCMEWAVADREQRSPVDDPHRTANTMTLLAALDARKLFQREDLDLSGANLAGACLTDPSPKWAVPPLCAVSWNLTGANLNDTAWDGIFFHRVNFASAQTRGARFGNVPRDAIRSKSMCSIGSDCVLCVSFSPDGAQIVSASDDKSVRVWDLASGAMLKQLKGHCGAVRSAFFSLDGAKIVSASDDGSIRVWDATRGTQLLQIEGHDGAVTSVAFSPDGTTIVSGSRDMSVRLWALASGAELTEFVGHVAPVNSVAFSPDGTKIASASDDETVRLWDATSGAELKAFQGHKSTVSHAAFSPDGTMIASASSRGSVLVWDVASRVLITQLMGNNGSSVAFSPDGTTIVSGALGKSLLLWDVRSGVQLKQMEGHAGSVTTVAFSPDGTKIVSGCKGKTVLLWDTASGTQLTQFEGHSSSVEGLSFSPNGTKMVSGSLDKTLRIWDTTSGAQLALFDGIDPVNSVSFSPDGARIASASQGKSVRLWDATSGMQLQQFDGHIGTVYAVSFSPDGTKIASGSSDTSIRLWDATTGAQLTHMFGHDESVRSLAFSLDGSKIVSGSDDQLLMVWELPSGLQVMQLEGHDDSVKSVAFSPDGSKTVSGSRDKSVRLWDLVSGMQLKQFDGHGAQVNSVAFSPDGARIISASDDKSVLVWDALCGALLKQFHGRSAPVKSLSFSPDGTTIATGASDGSVQLWCATGKEHDCEQLDRQGDETNCRLVTGDNLDAITSRLDMDESIAARERLSAHATSPSFDGPLGCDGLIWASDRPLVFIDCMGLDEAAR